MRKISALFAATAVAVTACGSSDDSSSDAPDDVTTSPASRQEADQADVSNEGEVVDESVVSVESPESTDSAASDDSTDAVERSDASCAEVAALFVAGPSVNADLADPESSAVCAGDNIVVSANGIPDYTYIQTSPGDPAPNDGEYTIPAIPMMADDVTAVPLLGAAAVTLSGIPIYGPTEGTGGDVLSLGGALSECGSHNGPTGFHIHILLTSENTDCLFTPAEVAESPQLVGYAFDGYPIYTGNDQYTSSWELTDESLFATDTWAAHTYIEGSGDLDECNGLTDADGNYAYYTTDSFPYALGCYTGEVELAERAGGGGGPGGGEGGDPAPDGDGEDGQLPPPGDDG